VLSRLVDAGNTVIVIEHNLDVIKTADWIVDMGPEGGTGGGTLVAEGPPEVVAGVSASHTGAFLRAVLAGRAVAASPRKRVSAAKAGAAKKTSAARKRA
jgi:excinuclease ABC subunit A